MESDILHILKELFYILIGPIMGLFTWLARRMHNRVDGMQNKINELDKSHAVQQAQVADIKEDIKNIDKKLDKIYDKVSK
tara:strand:+ start:1333 stop:1572 length:240 start_codon:yes stop_codon:yes gene_type:complete